MPVGQKKKKNGNWFIKFHTRSLVLCQFFGYRKCLILILSTAFSGHSQRALHLYISFDLNALIQRLGQAFLHFSIAMKGQNTEKLCQNAKIMM